MVETGKELANCEAETLKFGAPCREVDAEMAESQKLLEETTYKLGEEVDVVKQTL